MVSNCPPDTCYRCYEAGKRGPATKTHVAAQCNLPRRGGRGAQQMRVFLLPAGQNSYQDQLPAQIQEIHLDQGLIQQGYPDQQQAGEDQLGAYGNDYEGDFYYGEDDLNENKDMYQYDCTPNFSLVGQHQSLPPPTMNIIPTRSIQRFTFVCQNKQSVLAIDSGCEGNCMTEAEAGRLKVKILPLEQGDRTPNPTQPLLNLWVPSLQPFAGMASRPIGTAMLLKIFHNQSCVGCPLWKQIISLKIFPEKP